MIKIAYHETFNEDQLLCVIEGMRNPLNSWDKSDSSLVFIDGIEGPGDFYLGEKDKDLMRRLNQAGPEHRKFMRMMPVYMRITAPLYWWKEYDTYKIGTVANSCSTMHKIAEHEFTRADFSCDHMDNASLCILDAVIEHLNHYRHLYLNEHEIVRKKEYWWQLIQSLPTSYNQTRNVMVNYEVLLTIYKQRRHHKLDEWHVFCDEILKLPYSELITQEFEDGLN